MAYQVQVSIGQGSLGIVYQAVEASDLPAFVAQAAAANGYTAEAVQAKLNAGSTLWLDRAAGRKIRGYDAAAAELLAAQQAAARAQRQRADGYFRNY